MRAVVQRVGRGSVEVDGVVVGAIDAGLVVLVCAMEGDTDADVAWLAAKLPSLRIWPDASGRMHLALVDLEPARRQVLVISQFTLSADLGPGISKGNRPAFTRAMAPGHAEAMVHDLMARLASAGCVVAGGRVGAHKAVSLVNGGPVTLWLDTRQGRPIAMGPDVDGPTGPGPAHPSDPSSAAKPPPPPIEKGGT
jgi:D-tyrosyl-tRNA(Tyr) deacylase